jgi:hypothetical protein
MPSQVASINVTCDVQGCDETTSGYKPSDLNAIGWRARHLHDGYPKLYPLYIDSSNKYVVCPSCANTDKWKKLE